MARTVLQSKIVDGSATSSTTLAVTPDNPVTAGSSLYLIFTYSATSATSESVADTVNGSWPSVYAEHAIDTTNATLLGHARIDNVSAGTPTVTLTLGVTQAYRACLLVEVGGADGGGASGLHAGQWQSAPGAGADAITSGAVATSPIGANGLVVTLSIDSANNNPPTAGTGFTSQATLWQFGLGFGPFARWETKAVSSGATSVAGTFTRTGADPYGTMAAVFLESGGGGGSTIDVTPTGETLSITDSVSFDLSLNGLGDAVAVTDTVTTVLANGVLYDRSASDSVSLFGYQSRVFLD